MLTVPDRIPESLAWLDSSFFLNEIRAMQGYLPGLDGIDYRLIKALSDELLFYLLSLLNLIYIFHLPRILSFT